MTSRCDRTQGPFRDQDHHVGDLPISRELRNVRVVKNAALLSERTPPGSPGGADRRTRDRLTELLLERGTATATELGCALGLSTAGVRRHLDAMLADGMVVARERRSPGPRGRGRPARVFALTEYYVATGRANEAIAMLDTVVSDTADGNEARERLARAHAANGDQVKAAALIDQVLKWDSRNVRALVFKSQLLVNTGKREEAMAVLRGATSTDPNSIAAHFLLGNLHASRGDTAAAEKAYREVLRVNPRATAAQVEISRLQRASGNTAASLQTAEAAIQNSPRSLEVRLAFVRSLLAANDLKRAEIEVAKLLAEFPAVPAVLVQSGVLAATRHDTARARATFEKAQTLDPDSLEALTGLVLLDLTARDFAAAKNRIDSRLTGGRKPSPGLLMLAARTSVTAGEPEPAEQYLRQVIDADPSLLPAYGMLGQIYLKQRKLDQARQEFDKLAERQSKPVGALTMAGMILQAQGNTQEARKRYEQALASDPRAGVAANNLALLYVDSGENIDVALQHAQTAVAAMPEVPEVLDTLGWIYYKKNLPAQAIPPLARSVEKQPKNAVYHYHLGLAQVLAGDSLAGQESLQRALDLNPTFGGNDVARQKLAELKIAK